MAIIDIIMSAYNEEKCIERALLSIIRQEFTEWKLLVCDDFSEDKTLDILKEYEKKYPTKIIVFHNEKNMGLTYSLNRLISESTAPYIARMDADDICNLRRLQVEKEFLDNHKEFAMVGCNINKFDELLIEFLLIKSTPSWPASEVWYNESMWKTCAKA